MTTDQQTEMRTALFEYIRDRGSVTHVELCRDVPGFAGDDTAANPNNNIIFWQGVNIDAYNVLRDLIADNLVTSAKTNPLTYAFDGFVLSLPIAKRLDRAYKRPHWLPLVFNAAR